MNKQITIISSCKAYSVILTSRFTSLSGVQDHVIDCITINIAILLPTSGIIYQDSDTENVPNNLENDGEIFYPNGELEVDDLSNTGSSESEGKYRQAAGLIHKKDRIPYLEEK